MSCSKSSWCWLTGFQFRFFTQIWFWTAMATGWDPQDLLQNSLTTKMSRSVAWIFTLTLERSDNLVTQRRTEISKPNNTLLQFCVANQLRIWCYFCQINWSNYARNLRSKAKTCRVIVWYSFKPTWVYLKRRGPAKTSRDGLFSRKVMDWGEMPYLRNPLPVTPATHVYTIRSCRRSESLRAVSKPRTGDTGMAVHRV